MKTTHSTKTPCASVRSDVSASPWVEAPLEVKKGSIINKMIEMKKYTKAYLRGEISLAKLESLGIELG